MKEMKKCRNRLMPFEALFLHFFIHSFLHFPNAEHGASVRLLQLL
jgi:hypothetical protein